MTDPSRPTPGRADKEKLSDPPPGVAPWDLPPDLAELWEERVTIMHYDGGLSWPEAEARSLADVLGQPPAVAFLASSRQDGEQRPAGISAYTIHHLFPVEQESGPYGRAAS
jgi:hypothetical protein